ARLPRYIRVSAVVSGPMLEITVSDNGPGVAGGICSRIFYSFFTTKKPGAGTGIGLPVARGIAEGRGGTPGLVASAIGACFLLQLPVADTDAATTDTLRTQAREI